MNYLSFNMFPADLRRSRQPQKRAARPTAQQRGLEKAITMSNSDKSPSKQSNELVIVLVKKCFF